MIGRTLLHYTVLAELGTGAMGRVYRARDARTDRNVALKFLAVDAGPDARERMLREARAAARLSHPGIVGLFAIEETDGERFLVQEFVDGETLTTRLARGPLGTRETLRLARELASALAHAHAGGVLHRDLKPDNVLIAADGRFKIADFGIARVEGSPTLTGDGTLLGTLPYLAPERLAGHVGDARADLFALGAILYEVIAGRRAFPGASEAAVMYAVMNEDPPAPEHVAEATRPLVPTVMNLLNKTPALRPASAEVVSGVVEAIEGPSHGARRPGRSRPAWAVAVGAALLLALAGALWLSRSRASRGGGTSDAASQPALAVLTFENLIDPADPGRMGPIAGNLLVTSFAQSPELNVLSSQRILDAVHAESGDHGRIDASVALRVARRARAARIVTGRILQTSPALVMTAEVVDVASGRVLHAERIEGQPGQTLFDLVDELGGRLVSRMLRRDRASVGLAPVAERSSADLGAQRQYAEGLRWFTEARFDSAEARYAAAVEIDPGFAQAHYQRGITQWWLHDMGGARASIEAARRGVDRLSPAEREILPALDDLVRGRWAEASAALRAIVKRHPDDRLVQYARVEAGYHSGDDATAIEAGRAALKLDPGFGVAGVHLVDALVRSGQNDEARVTAEGLARRLPQNDPIQQRRFQTTLLSGRWAEAIALANADRDRSWVRDVPAAQVALYYLNRGVADSGRFWLTKAPNPAEGPEALRFVAALRQGRYRDALSASDRAWRDVTAAHRPDWPAIPAIAMGALAAGAIGRTDVAMARVDSIHDRLERWAGPDVAVLSTTMKAIVLLDQGRVAAADSLARAMEADIPAGRDDFVRTVRYVHALVAHARGHSREALDLERRSLFWGSPHVDYGMTRYDRIRYMQGAGLHAEALAALDTLERSPILFTEYAVRLPLLRARSLEAVGRNGEARAVLRAWLAARPNADPDLPDLAEARSALTRIERGGTPVARSRTPERTGGR